MCIWLGIPVCVLRRLPVVGEMLFPNTKYVVVIRASTCRRQQDEVVGSSLPLTPVELHNFPEYSKLDNRISICWNILQR